MTNLFLTTSIFQLNLSPSFKSNCFTIPVGTVVRNDSLFTFALFIDVIKPFDIGKDIGNQIFNAFYLDLYPKICLK